MPLTRRSDPEVDLFRRGREVLGKQAGGGLISKLLIAKQKNILSLEQLSSRHPQNQIRASTSARSSAASKLPISRNGSTALKGSFDG
jgi:hypothetical protein